MSELDTAAGRAHVARWFHTEPWAIADQSEFEASVAAIEQEARSAAEERCAQLREAHAGVANIARSASVMGLCSQTHHEHLMVDARHAVEAYDTAPATPLSVAAGGFAVARDEE